MKRTIKRWHWLSKRDGNLSFMGDERRFMTADSSGGMVLVIYTYDDVKPNKPRRKRAPGGKAPACRGKPR